LHRSTTLDGRGELSGSLDVISNAIVERALDEAMAAYCAEDPKPISERQADAMVEIMRQYLDTHEQPKGRRNRPHVSVITTLHDFANGGPGHISGGGPVDHSIMRMLSCDANLHRVTSPQRGRFERRTLRSAGPEPARSAARSDRPLTSCTGQTAG
jgi:hypothetical protein